MSDPNSTPSDILSDGPVKDILRPGCIHGRPQGKIKKGWTSLTGAVRSLFISRPPVIVNSITIPELVHFLLVVDKISSEIFWDME
jgi:hypothetical protein